MFNSNKWIILIWQDIFAWFWFSFMLKINHLNINSWILFMHTRNYWFKIHTNQKKSVWISKKFKEQSKNPNKNSWIKLIEILSSKTSFKVYSWKWYCKIHAKYKIELGIRIVVWSITTFISKFWCMYWCRHIGRTLLFKWSTTE